MDMLREWGNMSRSVWIVFDCFLMSKAQLKVQMYDQGEFKKKRRLGLSKWGFCICGAFVSAGLECSEARSLLVSDLTEILI